jgi:hypothetical protein
MATDFTIDTLLEGTSAKERFNLLDTDRVTVLDRARACSSLTIPSILPASGHTEETALESPYQGVGARLVNNLASKLLLSLLPPNTPFFRLIIDNDVKENVKQQDPNALKDVEQQLVNIEQGILKDIERSALRVPVFEAVKSLIVTGNSLCYKAENKLRVYKLDNYVILRDFEGNVIEIITREVVTKATLPDDIISKMDEETLTEDGDLYVYTRAVVKNGTWIEYQSVNDIFVEGSDSTYKQDANPFIPLRWGAINGENYGRGLTEQYLGDFRSLEALYQLLIEAAAVQSRVIFGKRPGAVIDIQDLNDADNGSFILGDLEQDITTLRVDKNSDLQIPLNMIQDLTRRLEQAFLVASSVARESERTTATEIRYMASDLEETLGGVYSVLSLEFQKPLAQLLLKESGVNLKQLGIEAVIVTGVEALGRNNELSKLRQFNSMIQELGSPELVLQRMNLDTYISKIGSSLGLDTTDLIKSNDQIQQEQQQAQEEALMQQGATNVVNGATTPQQS